MNSQSMRSVPSTSAATLSPTGASSPANVPAKRKFIIDERYIAPIFISLILIVADWQFRILESRQATALAIITSIAMELALGKLFTGKTPHLASAYISGISVGILVRSTELWPYALCSAIAITSKYVIRIDGRHIWNPSNLGIVALLLVAPQYVSTLSVQFSNSLWPMLIVWALGSAIIYRLKRFHICFTYVVCFISYAFLRHLIVHDSFWAEASPITGPMYQLFIFFMITDPKTTVKSKAGQMLVAFLVASAENVFRLYGSLGSPMSGSIGQIVASHAPYFALTLMGPTSNLIEIATARSHKRVTSNVNKPSSI